MFSNITLKSKTIRLKSLGKTTSDGSFWTLFRELQTTGSEYYYCVDKITEELKIPHFFCCVSSPNCSSVQTVLSGPSESPIPRLGIGSGLNFCCVEKNWPRQDRLDREQFGKETQPRNEVLGIHWAQTAQFELKSSLERKHNRKNAVFSTLLLFYQHNNNTHYLCSDKQILHDTKIYVKNSCSFYFN